jgi:hypothetical protein
MPHVVTMYRRRAFFFLPLQRMPSKQHVLSPYPIVFIENLLFLRYPLLFFFPHFFLFAGQYILYYLQYLLRKGVSA